MKIMDFHLEVCKDMSVAEAHELVDRLEKKLKEKFLEQMSLSTLNL